MEIAVVGRHSESAGYELGLDRIELEFQGTFLQAVEWFMIILVGGTLGSLVWWFGRRKRRIKKVSEGNPER